MSKHLWCWLLIGLASACSAEPTSSAPPSSGSGGGTTTGGSGFTTGGVAKNTGGTASGSGGTSGASTTGGTSAGGTSTGGTSTGGSTGGMKATGGVATTGGVAGGAGKGGVGGSVTGGSAGAAVGGTAGAAAGGSGGTPPSGATKSAGCGKGGRPSGGVVTVNGSHIYSFPETYDGTTPMPLILAFHAAGNGNDQLRNITKSSALEKNFVMAFPKSKGSQWVLNTDSASVEERYQELLSNYCIDTSRVFATGHSSGAQLITQFLCKGETRFKAVAPVASSAYCMSYAKAIPVLDIHGSNDRERGNTSQDADGMKDLAVYRTSNGCGMDTTPHAAATCMRGGTTVMPGCVDYSGCTQPLTFCSHNDPEYSNTNHGWPCFANQVMNDFFLGLP